PVGSRQGAPNPRVRAHFRSGRAGPELPRRRACNDAAVAGSTSGACGPAGGAHPHGGAREDLLPEGLLQAAEAPSGQGAPHFVTWVWEGEHLSKCLTEDVDAVCCVGAKSGTTWLTNNVHQIRTLGDPDNFLDMNTHTML
ncbi:unnamed protein product, partial [Prorocentrum cordatum]